MVTVFVYHKKTPLSPRQIKAVKDCLSVREKKVAARFKRAKDIETSLLSKFLKRKVAAFFLNKKDKEVCFGENKYHRPFVLDSDIDLNVSHSGDWVVVAVGGSQGVGVDVEQVNAVDLHVYSDCFADQELEYLQNFNSESQERFFQLWTLKESYLKYKGTGLAGGLKSFYCSFNPGLGGVNILCSKTQEPSPGLCCYSGKLDENHWLGLVSCGQSWNEKIKHIDLDKTLSSGRLSYTEKSVAQMFS
jgi:4'-phosphopantetheinyl transferase